MKATEDFLRVVLFAHILAASKSFISMNDKISLRDIAQRIVNTFVCFHTPYSSPSSDEERSEDGDYHSTEDGNEENVDSISKSGGDMDGVTMHVRC